MNTIIMIVAMLYIYTLINGNQILVKKWLERSEGRHELDEHEIPRIS